jgi:hypothetical protein
MMDMATRTRPAMPVNLEFGTSRIHEERRVVIRNRQTLEELWYEHMGADGTAPPPAVDFRGADVIGYFAGPRSSGGFRISIPHVSHIGRIAIVNVVISKPAPGEHVPLAFTYPGIIRTVPKLPVVVRFQVTTKTR